MLETLAKVVCFFRVRESKLFIRESFAKVGYYETLSLYTLQLAKGHPGSGRRMVPHHIGSSQASEGESNTMVLKHILAPAAATA